MILFVDGDTAPAARLKVSDNNYVWPESLRSEMAEVDACCRYAYQDAMGGRVSIVSLM
jgi:hypothetical protein